MIMRCYLCSNFFLCLCLFTMMGWGHFNSRFRRCFNSCLCSWCLSLYCYLSCWRGCYWFNLVNWIPIYACLWAL
uniref:Uncharacterized protein n=1 Tax=Picea glauca TaxID=3330 RepID=A0A101LV94_PICGL|nr:hypothetical protein ABT39_MTgene2064 [Picea glauca]